eukprot:774901-Rhodomonas_salina.1
MFSSKFSFSSWLASFFCERKSAPSNRKHHHEAEKHMLDDTEMKAECNRPTSAELARVVDLSRATSAASSCSEDPSSSSTDMSRETQNRRTGLELERARMQSNNAEDDDDVPDACAWAQEFEALCSC